MKNQDVYRWSYKNTEDMFEPYHCKSRIGIYKAERDVLADTFWSGSYHNNRCFSMKECEELLDLTYLGNLGDFESAREYDQAMYDDKDFLNLNHSNSSRGNCYLRKGAVKSKEKMHKIIKRNAAKLKADYEYARKAYQREIDKLGYEDLEYVSALDGVSLADDSYEDEEFKGEQHERINNT